MSIDFYFHLENMENSLECRNAPKSFGKVCGTIQSGKFKGSSRLIFEDGSQMQVYFKSGLIHGKTFIYDKNNVLIALGRYEFGLPHGPFWIFNHYQYAQIHFLNGELGMQRIMVP